MILDSIFYVLSLAPAFGGVPTHVPGDYVWDNDSEIVLQQEGTAFIKLWDVENVQCDAAPDIETLVPDPYGPEHSNWRLAAGGDLGADGRPDFIFQNTDSRRLVVWDMFDLVRFDGGFLDPMGPTQPQDLRCSSDFTGDGQADLGFQHTGNNSVWVWKMNPDSPRQRLGSARQLVSDVPGFDPAGYYLAGCGDFSGEGLADLVLRAGNGNVVIAVVEGYHITEVHTVAGPGRALWTVGGIGDLDRDGHYELIWQRDDNHRTEAWKMDYWGYVCTIPLTGPDPASRWRIVGPK